jgi:Zn ribbon nucleic-acid-binding protein
MAQNRIQFQKSLSLRELLDNYVTEAQCAAALEKMRWSHGYICPDCESKSHCVVWHGKVKTFQCNRCHAQMTMTSRSISHSTKLPLTTWFQAIYFLSQTKNNVSALELTQLLGVCYRTAWRIQHKIMQVMCEREQMTILSGRV